MDPIQTVQRLIAKATDAGASPEEQRSCAKAAVDLIKKHGLATGATLTGAQREMMTELNQWGLVEAIKLTFRVADLEDELARVRKARDHDRDFARDAVVKKLTNELKQWRAYGAKQEALKEQQQAEKVA